MTFPTSTQIAWMAALFEGEGYAATPNKRNPLRIRFKMCDRDVLERFQRFAGGGHLCGPHKPSGLGKKPTYSLSVQGVRAYALLVAFWPWLGSRRQTQVSHVISAWSQLRSLRVLSPEQVRQIREQLATGKHGIGRQLARQYGVTDGMICNIKHGRAWV